MSDDEVLNLPAWGRPSTITRSKVNRVWYEEWIYRWRIGRVQPTVVREWQAGRDGNRC